MTTGRQGRTIVAAVLLALISLVTACTEPPPPLPRGSGIVPPAEIPADLGLDRQANIAAWPFDPPPVSVLRASPKKVFAHWHVWPISLDNQPAGSDYWSRELMTPAGRKGRDAAGGGFARERPLPRPVIADADWAMRDLETEVARASLIGLDGFMFNIVGPPPNKHFDRLLKMLDAAQRVDPSFRIALMVDAVANKDATPEQLADAIAPLAKHPSVFKAPDGRLVLAAFTAERKPMDWWTELFTRLKDAGVAVYFVPLFQGWRDQMSAFAPLSEGFSDWGRRTPTGARQMMPAAAQAHAQGKIWMAPVAPQLNRPKNLFYKEARGSEAFRDTWEVAIEGGADWVQIITWNDYGEGTEIAPSTGIQYAFYDLAAFYTAWFKTGRQPEITRDVLYYFHRLMPTDAAAASGPQERAFDVREAEPPRDEIELLAFLTAPGTLEIAIGGKTYRQEAPAGITSFRAPLANGRPQFRLVRGGKTVTEVASPFEIRSQMDFQDMLYRAGSSSRPPVAMLANPPVSN
jgi:hypothetical protein